MTIAAAQAQVFELTASGVYPRFSRAPLGSADTTAPAVNDTKITGRYGYGAQITLNTRGYYGFELGYSHNRAYLYATGRPVDAEGVSTEVRRQSDILVRQANVNFLAYMMPAGELWRPYITVGIYAAQYGAPHFAEWPGGGSRNYGINFGGGFKLLLGHHFIIRWDARDYFGGRPYKQLTLAPSGNVHNLEGSMGIGIGF